MGKKLSFKTSIFIAREYLLIDDYGSVRIDEEAVFISYEEAKSFLKSLEESDADTTSLLQYRTEIVEIPVSGKKMYDYIKRWVFSINGKLLEAYPETDDSKTNLMRFSYNKKFETGDIVFIKPNLHNSLSPFINGEFAIVIDTPTDKESWKAKGYDLKEWEPMYNLHHITDNGIINHRHIYEECIEKPEDKLPIELIFLKIYSEHLKKKKEISQKTINDILNNLVYVRNTKKFDLKKKFVENEMLSSEP